MITLIGLTKRGGASRELNAICDRYGRPLNLFATANSSAATSVPECLPDVDWLLGDGGYDADRLRKPLKEKGIRERIPGSKQRKIAFRYNKRRYKRHNHIEIMFGRLKD